MIKGVSHFRYQLIIINYLKKRNLKVEKVLSKSHVKIFPLRGRKVKKMKIGEGFL